MKQKPNELSKKDVDVLEWTIIAFLLPLYVAVVVGVPYYLLLKWGDGPAVASFVGLLILTMVLLDLSDGKESNLKALASSYARIIKRGLWLAKQAYSRQTLFEEEDCKHSWEIDYQERCAQCSKCGVYDSEDL